MNISRRGFLIGTAALAAIAVAPSFSKADAPREFNRIHALIKSGAIRGETFYLSGPLVLSGIKNLIIEDCRFVALPEFPPHEAMITIDACENIRMNTCVIIGSEVEGVCGLRIISE